MDQYTGLILLAIPVLLLVLLTSRARRQQRALAAAQATVRPGLRVMTTSGLHATVVSLENESTVVLEVAPGVNTRWAKLAIAEIFDETPDADSAVLDLTSTSADREPAVRDPSGEPDENEFRSDDDRDNRTLT